MAVELRPLFPGLGVELKGFDPNRLDEPAAKLFRQAFRDHRIVLLRDVELSDEAGVALTETLGPVSFKSPFMRKGGGRKFSYVSNQHADGTLRDGELLFHADHSFLQWPLKAISLYAMQVPATGGETLFTDAAAAYARLPERLKARVAGLSARHVANYNLFEGDGRPRYDPASGAKAAVHPVAWPHPESGAPILFVSRLLTERILELSPEESEDLLLELFTYVEDEAHAYEHRWRAGDYLVWDNRQLQHSRRDFDPAATRALRRTPIDDPLDPTAGSGLRNPDTKASAH